MVHVYLGESSSEFESIVNLRPPGMSTILRPRDRLCTERFESETVFVSFSESFSRALGCEKRKVWRWRNKSSLESPGEKKVFPSYSGPMLFVSPTLNNHLSRVSSLNYRYQSERIGGRRIISRSGSSRGKKGFPRPEREAPRHPRATSRGIVQQHFPGPRSHSYAY